MEWALTHFYSCWLRLTPKVARKTSWNRNMRISNVYFAFCSWRGFPAFPTWRSDTTSVCFGRLSCKYLLPSLSVGAESSLRSFCVLFVNNFQLFVQNATSFCFGDSPSSTYTYDIIVDLCRLTLCILFLALSKSLIKKHWLLFQVPYECFDYLSIF